MERSNCICSICGRVTTGLDPTIPLTTYEWVEWGDPREKEYYEYMLSYSPYDQVSNKEYPNLLVTAGFFGIECTILGTIKVGSEAKR